MKTHKTITKLITLIMTAALLCAGSLLQCVNAQTGDGSVRLVSYASLGIIHGQKIRLSVANTEASGTLSYSFSFYLAHGTNASISIPLYESELIKVPTGEFRFSDIAREDLVTEGELATGRAQLIVKVDISAPAGSDADDFPASLEIIQDEVQDGQTVQTNSKYRLIIVAAQER